MKIICILIAIAVVIAAGCATVRESYAPDGRKAFALNCSGVVRGWDKCHAAAGDICKEKGYDIVDRTSEDAAVISAYSHGGLGAKTNERSMLVACKP